MPGIKPNKLVRCPACFRVFVAGKPVAPETFCYHCGSEYQTDGREEMAITTTKQGTADDSSILGMNIVRQPDGNLQVEVFYEAGVSKHLTLTASENFKTRIEGTYAEIIAAINVAEGLV